MKKDAITGQTNLVRQTSVTRGSGGLPLQQKGEGERVRGDEVSLASHSSLLQGDTPASKMGESSRLPAALQRLVKAADQAPLFLVKGNMPENFALHGGSEVDPGSIAYEGVDGKGREIWVVDQKLHYRISPAFGGPACGRIFEISEIFDPPRLDESFLDGFFSGRAAGVDGKGPNVKVLAVERNGRWEEVSREKKAGDVGFMDAVHDPSVRRFIVEVGGVHPLPGIGEIMPPGSFTAVVDARSIVRKPDETEFTLHFLNPDQKQGPFPGTTDGAMRYRARLNQDGSATVEGYYVTRAAREYLDPLTDSLPLGRTGKSLFSLGRTIFRFTPVGFFMGPLADAVGKGAVNLADAAIGAAGATRLAVSTLHARYYRTSVVSNLMGGSGG